MEYQSNLKDFQIIRKIGDGSFSQVFLAKRIQDQNYYALKKIKLNLLSLKEKQNSLNEVRLLASIQNPNIIQYKDTFIDESQQSLYLVLEHASQGDILAKLKMFKKKQQRFPEDQIWRCIIHILTGLQSLHSQKICHRDIKCGNIFICQDQNNQPLYKLGDFNVSKITENDVMRTQAGTPYYCAPEIWKNQLYDCKSDIWSLGCVIYEMSNFKPPFIAQNIDQLCKKIIKAEFQRIDNFYSDDLAQFIQDCLQAKPSKRPSSKTLLNSSLIQRKIQELQENNQQQKSIDLINTIKMPITLKQLQQQLPKANYDIPKQRERSNFILKTKSVHQSQNQNQSVNQKEKQMLQHLSPDIQIQKMNKENIQQKNIRSISIFSAHRQQQNKQKITNQPQQNDYNAIKIR